MYYESFNRYFVSSFSKGVNVVLINSTHIKKETLIFKVRNFIGLHWPIFKSAWLLVPFFYISLKAWVTIMQLLNFHLLIQL